MLTCLYSWPGKEAKAESGKPLIYSGETRKIDRITNCTVLILEK
jgi:hypothetical protein